MKRSRAHLTLVALCWVLVANAGCPRAASVAIELRPRTVQLTAGDSVHFTAAVSGASDPRVTWSVAEPSGGTIDATGEYVSPQRPGTYHVVARPVAAPGVSATASVTVASASPTAQSCATEPLRTAGAIHYFCDCQAGAAPGCVAGDDARTAAQARNPATPWRTANKARSTFASMAAGDTVALCRGGAFTYSGGGGYDLWRNRSCTAGSTCDFRDYAAPWGTGSEPRPVIQVADGGHFFYGVHSGGANAADAVQGFRFMNLEVRAGQPYKGYAFNPAHYMSDLTVCNTVIDGFDIAVYQDNLVTRATYQGNRFLNSASDAILAEADGLTIDGNYFDNNGHNITGGTALEHTIYLGGASSHDVRITNNDIHRSTMSGGASGAGRCAGTILVAHGGIDGLLIENNLLDAPSGGCWGLSLTGGGFPGYCYFRNTVIRRNRIENVGNMSLGVESCAGCVIEDNVVVGSAEAGGISVPTGACTCSGGCDKTSGVVVRNNTVWFPSTVTGGVAISVTEGAGHVVASNAIEVAGGAGINCFKLSLPAASYALVDNNLCHGASRWESSKGSLDAWRSATGFDASSTVAAPGFVDPAAGDLTPGPGSPLIGGASRIQFAPTAVGSPTWSPSDPGKERDASPDIGAFER